MAEKTTQVEEVQQKERDDRFDTFFNTTGLALSGAIRSLSEHIDSTNDIEACKAICMVTEAFNNFVRTARADGAEE